MIDEIIRPGLINPRDACYVDAFIQLLFHILPLRLLIIVLPIISALCLMLVATSQDRLIDDVSLTFLRTDTMASPLKASESGGSIDAPRKRWRDKWMIRFTTVDPDACSGTSRKAESSNLRGLQSIINLLK
jgi:hypothetical protein